MFAITETAFEKACEVLSREYSPIGLMASPEGYPHQVWPAGMYVFAYWAAHDCKLPQFGSVEW